MPPASPSRLPSSGDQAPGEVHPVGGSARGKVASVVEMGPQQRRGPWERVRQAASDSVSSSSPVVASGEATISWEISTST